MLAAAAGIVGGAVAVSTARSPGRWSRSVGSMRLAGWSADSRLLYATELTDLDAELVRIDARDGDRRPPLTIPKPAGPRTAISPGGSVSPDRTSVPIAFDRGDRIGVCLGDGGFALVDPARRSGIQIHGWPLDPAARPIQTGGGVVSDAFGPDELVIPFRRSGEADGAGRFGGLLRVSADGSAIRVHPLGPLDPNGKLPEITPDGGHVLYQPAASEPAAAGGRPQTTASNGPPEFDFSARRQKPRPAVRRLSLRTGLSEPIAGHRLVNGVLWDLDTRMSVGNLRKGVIFGGIGDDTQSRASTQAIAIAAHPATRQVAAFEPWVQRLTWLPARYRHKAYCHVRGLHQWTVRPSPGEVPSAVQTSALRMTNVRLTSWVGRGQGNAQLSYSPDGRLLALLEDETHHSGPVLSMFDSAGPFVTSNG